MSPPFNETWAALEDLVDRGLVRSIGLSNFSPEKVQQVLKHARIRPAVNQVRLAAPVIPFSSGLCPGLLAVRLARFWVTQILACVQQFDSS